MMIELSGGNLIGQSVSAESKDVFWSQDPSRLVRLEPAYHGANAAEVDRTMRLAETAFDAYRSQAPEQRAAFLRAIADGIEGLGEELVERATAETALGASRIRGERVRTTNQIRMFADLVDEGWWVDARIDHAIPDRAPSPKPDLRRMLVAIGPVVVFGASNFPLAFSAGGGDTASALAAGCPVVVKAHPAHPGTSELVGRAILEAARSTGMPDGVFSLLHGPKPETGLALVRHPYTKAVGFTGSLKAGRALFDAAAARSEPIPVYAEMGSTNPVFILPEAAQERGDAIAEGLHQSFTLGVGQYCTKPGVVIGVGEGTKKVLDSIVERVKATPVGTMLYEGLADSYRAGTEVFEGFQGVRVAGSTRDASELPATQVTTTVFTTDAKRFLEHEELSKEVFGPTTLIVESNSREELLEIAQGLEGHLTATIHGTDQDLEAYQDLVRVLERKVGRLLFNGWPTGVEVCPSIHHGGPYPATTDVHFTSVGTASIYRFARPICYQDFPQASLPPELQDGNPRNIWRLVNSAWTKD